MGSTVPLKSVGGVGYRIRAGRRQRYSEVNPDGQGRVVAAGVNGAIPSDQWKGFDRQNAFLPPAIAFPAYHESGAHATVPVGGFSIEHLGIIIVLRFRISGPARKDAAPFFHPSRDIG